MIMASYSARFGVGSPGGDRSSEWLIVWKPEKSDVYLATRTLGGALKASFHEGGRCHVHAPDPRCWRSQGPSPRFLDVWAIDPQSSYQFPFAVVIPRSELRQGIWAKHRDKGTIWIPAQSEAVEIAVFFTRAEPRPFDSLRAAGWHTTVVVERLPDGRDLWVVAGDAQLPDERRVEIENLRTQIRRFRGELAVPPANPRLLLFATNEEGTRRFVEAAA